MTIRDEGGGQAVVGQLAPDRIQVPRDLLGDSIAQVGGETGSCVNGTPDLLGGCVGVSQGNDECHARPALQCTGRTH